VKPSHDEGRADYDLVLISQPWRARMDAEFKVSKVLEPMVKALAPGGRALVAQSSGNDPAMELVRQVWPNEDPFKVTRHELIEVLKEHLGDRLSDYQFHATSDSQSVLSYRMHTLPDDIQSNIGTSTLFAAWNAAVYVAQIENDRLEEALTVGEYLAHTERILKKFGGLWFNDEVFVVSRKK
jgi:hypothetical protein